MPRSSKKPAHRSVRGILFVDYVRMVRSRKDIDWMQYLDGPDLSYLVQSIDPDAWYPMETFERLGVAILKEIAQGQLEGVRMWGRFQVHPVRKHFPTLVAPADPRDTMMRFASLTGSFFDYAALRVADVSDARALVEVAYGMGEVAEETASYQTAGFLEGLAEAAGAKNASASFTSRSWRGDPVTAVDLRWEG